MGHQFIAGWTGTTARVLWHVMVTSLYWCLKPETLQTFCWDDFQMPSLLHESCKHYPVLHSASFNPVESQKWCRACPELPSEVNGAMFILGTITKTEPWWPASSTANLDHFDWIVGLNYWTNQDKPEIFFLGCNDICSWLPSCGYHQEYEVSWSSRKSLSILHWTTIADFQTISFLSTHSCNLDNMKVLSGLWMLNLNVQQILLW